MRTRFPETAQHPAKDFHRAEKVPRPRGAVSSSLSLHTSNASKRIFPEEKSI